MANEDVVIKLLEKVPPEVLVELIITAIEDLEIKHRLFFDAKDKLDLLMTIAHKRNIKMQFIMTEPVNPNLH